MTEDTKNKSLKTLTKDSLIHGMRIKECAQIFEQMEQQDDEQRAKTFQRFVEMAVEEWRDNNNTRECSEVTDLLRHLDSSMTMESSNESQMELISDQEIANFNIKYRALIESIINALTQEGLSVKTYYNRLFNDLLKVCEGKKSIEKGICLEVTEEAPAAGEI